MKTTKFKTALQQWSLWLILALGAILMLLPFWVMLVTSLLPAQKAYIIAPVLFPWPLHGENYQRLFTQAPMARYFINSLVVSLITTGLHTFLCAMAAYGFSRLTFPFKNALFFLFLITMMIPPQINMVPLFFMMKHLHWIDTYWALIVPGLFGAFGVFLLRQWFNGLPKELEDAARIDGCHPWAIFWKIALPLAKPALVALAIFVFINSWNSFMWPLVVTQSEAMRTLPVGIAALKGSFRDISDWTALMAAATVSIVPVVIIFLLGQKHFIKGLLAGSIKE